MKWVLLSFLSFCCLDAFYSGSILWRMFIDKFVSKFLCTILIAFICMPFVNWKTKILCCLTLIFDWVYRVYARSYYWMLHRLCLATLQISSEAIMILVSVSSYIIRLFLPGWRVFEFIVHLSGRAGNVVSRKSWGESVIILRSNSCYWWESETVSWISIRRRCKSVVEWENPLLIFEGLYSVVIWTRDWGWVLPPNVEKSSLWKIF